MGRFSDDPDHQGSQEGPPGGPVVEEEAVGRIVRGVMGAVDLGEEEVLVEGGAEVHVQVVDALQPRVEVAAHAAEDAVEPTYPTHTTQAYTTHTDTTPAQTHTHNTRVPVSDTLLLPCSDHKKT